MKGPGAEPQYCDAVAGAVENCIPSHGKYVVRPGEAGVDHCFTEDILVTRTENSLKASELK